MQFIVHFYFNSFFLLNMLIFRVDISNLHQHLYNLFKIYQFGFLVENKCMNNSI